VAHLKRDVGRVDAPRVTEDQADRGRQRRPRRRRAAWAAVLLVGCSALLAATPTVQAPFVDTTDSTVDVTASSSYYRDAVLADDPVGYWRLSDGGATAADVTGDHPGVYENAPQLGAAGRSADGDTAVGLDGVDDSVRVDHQYGLIGRSPFSVEMLYRADGYSGAASRTLVQQYLFESPPGGESWKGWMTFTYQVGGEWKFFVGRCSGIEADGLCDYANSATTLQPGTCHLAATYDGTTMRVYVDGALDGQFTSTRSLPAVTAPLRLGWDGSYYPTLEGTLDEVALFDVALSAARIQAHAARAG
jgi:hypothetical protein